MNRKNIFAGARLAIGSLLVAIATCLAIADEPAERHAEPKHMSLVRQLGSPAFRQREEAARKLLAIGIDAKAALIEGMQQEDLEIRLGAHRLLIEVMQNDFNRRIAAFLRNEDIGDASDLPGWIILRTEVGDNSNARQLYAEMLRAENNLLAAMERKDASLEQLLLERIQYLTSSRVIINGRRPPISTATLATILLVDTQLQRSSTSTSANVPVNPLTSRIYSILNYTTTGKMLMQQSYAPQIKKLFVGWIDGISDSKNNPYGLAYAMQLTLKFELREQGPRVARKVLKNPGPNASSIPYAAIVLGRFGTAKDVKSLEPHLSNTQVFHTWSNGQLKKGPIRIQVRDAVLAMTIHLHGENPADFGFKLLQPDATTIYKIYTFGFLTDAERDAAFAKWKAHTEKAKDVATGKNTPTETDSGATAEKKPSASEKKAGKRKSAKK